MTRPGWETPEQNMPKPSPTPVPEFEKAVPPPLENRPARPEPKEESR